MYIRLLTGRYAGEVRDVAIVAARAMLADGRAELEDAVAEESPEPEVRAEAPNASAPPAEQTAARRQRGARR